MEYRIISVSYVVSVTKALEKLARSVNEAIARGWEPIGGVTIAGNILSQPMIKRR